MRNQIPGGGFIDTYRSQWDENPDLDWLGITSATGMTDNSEAPVECLIYYPQVFYGYWIPFDPDALPEYREDRNVDLPRYEQEATPIFLPQTVDAPRIRAGYPLGEIGDQYRRCIVESEAREAGYYFVEHPTGNYCEKIR